MREVKFRGKRLSDGKWEYGSLVLGSKHSPSSQGRAWIAIANDLDFEVDPETVGQYTCRKDRDDVEIYEDDVIGYCGYLAKPNEFHVRRRVAWKETSRYTGFNVGHGYTSTHADRIKVLGNMHDSPEVLTPAR